MIDIIKIHEAQHGITGFLSVSIDCFSTCASVCVCVFQGCCNGAVSREKRSSIANSFHVYIFISDDLTRPHCFIGTDRT